MGEWGQLVFGAANDGDRYSSEHSEGGVFVEGAQRREESGDVSNGVVFSTVRMCDVVDPGADVYGRAAGKPQDRGEKLIQGVPKSMQRRRVDRRSRGEPG